MVPPARIELALPCGNGILNPARLPIPPEGQPFLSYNEKLKGTIKVCFFGFLAGGLVNLGRDKLLGNKLKLLKF